MPDIIKTTLQQPEVIKTVITVAQGPAGADGAAGSFYDHDQMSASALWTVTHNLGKYPSVTVIDSAGNNVEGDVVYLNNNQLTIEFSAAFSGHAYIN